MFVYYQLAIHWPAYQKLEVHLTNGRVRVFTGAGIDPILSLLHRLQVPVLFMQGASNWQQGLESQTCLSLAHRAN
ncbi:MAG: hypothetical protein KF690_10820 [Bacteroidetes bacterium]|nr:hypothetical protein [Bacteroidota bacterium]